MMCVGSPVGNEGLLLLDLNSTLPLSGYSLEGGSYRSEPSYDCPFDFDARVRDLTPDFALFHGPSGLYLTAEPLSGRQPLRFPWVPLDAKDVRLAPSGDRLAFAGDYQRPVGGCRSGIALARSESRNWQSIWCSPPAGNPPSAVSWSADETKLAFSFAGNIYILRIADRSVRLLTPGEWPRWSPGDGRLAFSHGDSIVVIPDETFLSRSRTLPIPGLISSGVEWTPDGKLLSVVHKTAIQPGDSRTSTVLGMLDVQRWSYHDVGTQLWGTYATLRWTTAGLKSLVQAQSVACHQTR